MFKSKYQKMINAQLALIDVQVRNFTIKALESMMKIDEMLSKRQYDEARGYTPMVFDLLSMYRRSIESYITQSVRKIFETNGEFSFSLNDIQKEKAKVFSWFDEISDQTKEFQKKLESKDNEKIFESLHRVLRKISDEQNLVDFKNTLISLQSEYLVYLIREERARIEIGNLNEKDTADRLFGNLITHPQIKQASQNYFKNEEYRTAVLDAMISLEVMIKEKAKFPADNKGKELSGVPLMHKVFDSDNPILSWCEDKRQIDRDELEGYKHIFAGAMQGIRDPKAHAIFQISPMRALKLLSLATLLAELVDASKYVGQDQRTNATKPKETKKQNKDVNELWKPLPKINFTVAQRLLRKLQFPQVGWEAYNDSPYQLKVRIEVHPILGGRDLHPLPDNDINGNKVYPVEPQNPLFGNGCFTLPEVCATSKDELILEIQATVEDINDPRKGEYKLVPQRWKYVREYDTWSYYPQRPMTR